MARTREQNIRAARAFADFFRPLLTRVAIAADMKSVDAQRFDYTLMHLDRHELWARYLEERSLRSNAFRGHADLVDGTRSLAEVEAAIPADVVRSFNLHAFLARAMITPASALRGRAWFYLEAYCREGVKYAAHVIADDPAKRKELIAHWNTLSPSQSNLDVR